MTSSKVVWSISGNMTTRLCDIIFEAGNEVKIQCGTGLDLGIGGIQAMQTSCKIFVKVRNFAIRWSI